MIALFIDLLIWAGKTLAGKYVDRVLDRPKPGKLLFSKVAGVYRYSHYVGQNHVRYGGEKRIYQADVSLTVFNPSKSDKVIRELTLHCTVNGKEDRFRLF